MMMELFLGIVIGLLVFSVIVLVASYLTSSSYLGTATIVWGVFLIASIVHMPEGMPGGEDNPNGEAVHPYKMILFCIFAVGAFYTIGLYYPELYAYPVHES